MERAAGQGLCVSKPWGDSSSYDFVIGRPGHFVSVQVKSTVCQSGGGYECCIRGRKNEAYEPGSFDFLAAYVVLKDAWYIIPAGAVLGKETVALFSKSKHANYEGYREAWHLLREPPRLVRVPRPPKGPQTQNLSRILASAQWRAWKMP